MAIKRRFNELQDLAVQPVQNEFTGPVSPYFTISELPNPVPQGKSSFLIDGADELLEDGYDVLFEIITQNEDGDDVTIYTEAVANYIEGRSRRVSIEVYEETPPGPATLVILAVASHIKRNPNSPPQRPTKFEFGARGRPKRRKKRGKKRRFRRLREGDRFFREYNIRQEVEILINPTSTNTEPIFFYQEPRIRVREVFKPFITNLTSASILTVSGASIAGNVVEQNQSTTTPPLPFGTSLRKGKKKRRNRKFAMKGGFGRRGFLSRRSSPEPETYTFTSPLFNLSSRYAGGTLELDSPSVDTSKFTLESYHIVPPTASFEIVDVKNSSTLIPDEPFKVYNTQTQAYEIAPITPASFSIKFQPEVTESVSLTNFKSYADVRVSNIRTFSGDVFRTKVYRKSEVNAGDFEIFADLPLESSELLLNSQSPTGLERTGYFVTQSDVVNFYDIHYGRFGSEFKSTDLTESGSSYNNDIKTDSVRISGSNFEFDKAITFELTGSHSFRIDNAVEYDIGFTAYGIQKKKQVKTDTGIVEKQQARMSVFLSGSAIELDNTHNGMFGQSQNDPFFGKYLGSLVVDGSSEKDFGVVKVDYEGKTAGDSVIKFRVEAGEFYLSDISIRPATETGFSPDLFTFEVPMPDGEARPDTFEFLAEFYDVNSNTADAIAFTTGSQFSGSNMVITGTDNVMESNLFIGGESTASGMHLGGVSSQLPEGGPGAEGSAFMRSVGYTGFTSASRISLADPGDLGVGKAGFMFYSGSVLPNSGDNYTGVGLELVGQSGSLRFSTSPSRFEVQADAFFVGRQNIQFISGAAGNIEISSSGIHLTPEGSVTASSIILGNKSDGQFLQFNDGQLTVQGNLSVDNIQTPALIDGNPSTITNASASITAQGLAKFVSASIGGLDVDSVGISSKSKNLILSQSGQITGSTVLFDGGKIGGFDIKGTGTDVVEGIASSDGSLILSGSGQITGSNVSFIGGKIGGWTLSGGQISAENLILRSEGVIKSANYVSDTAGFIITHEQDGFAEFGNARIRGTMATTTFEKESVNAVGGQLFVANSAALTGSAINTTVASMSLVNVTGFKAGEVIIIKKVSDTGFNTEYVSVVSSSLQGSGSEDLSGNLFVKRGLGFYTRPQVTYVGDESQGSAPTHGQYTISSNTDIVLKHTNITGGDTFNSQGGGSGGLNGFDFGDFRAKTVSESFNVHFSASVGSAGGMTAVDVRLLNNDDSDSLIGSRRVWNSADGAGQIDKHLNYPIGALNPNPSGSRIKVSVRLTNPGANARFNRPSASFDYGYEGTVQLGESGSVGDPIGGPSTYEPGQVVVSSGRVGTGYIRLNANPNNLATPYIDIVERTGSDIYDVELKARIGDLSGVAGTRNVPSNFDGFGLMSEVAFLSGSNIKLEAPSFLLGDLNANFISGSNSNIEISSSKFHIKQDGDVIVRKVDAEEGTIAGFTVADTGLTSTGVGMFPAGQTNAFSAGTGGSPAFRVTHAGALTATTATITGDINADTGTFGGSSNGFTIEASKLHNSHDSSFLGLVDANAAHADVGSVSAFYAGATANTGEGAGISFGSDGIIRGTGVYSRNNKQFLIGAETIFGDGRDGDIRISFAGTSIQVWNNTTNSSPTSTISGIGHITSVTYGDTIMSKLSAGDDETLTLQRDIYVKTLILDIDTDKGKIDCNGFRIFASEGIFIHCDADSTNTAFIFRNNGEDGSNGGNGGSATNSGATGGSVPAATAGSAGGGGAAPFTDGTLVSPGAGANGGAGCSGGPVNLDGGFNTDFTSNAAAGGAGVNPQDGLSNANPMISNFSGTTGGSGGSGGQSNLGAGGSSAGGAGAGGSLVQAGIQWFSTPADSIVKFRAEYGSNDYPARLTTMPGNSAGGGGGGGRGGVDGAAGNFSGGGAGGGGGGAGSSGGPICIVAKVIDWWKTAEYSANVTSPGNNTGHHGNIVCKSIAGDGGNGGNGSNGNGFGAAYGGGGGGGGGGAGGNGGTILIVTSNLSPTTGPLGTLTLAHTITDPDDSDNKLTYDTFQATTNGGGNDIGMKSAGGSGGSGGSAGSAGGGGAAAGTAGSAGNDGKEGPCPVIII